MCVFSGNRLCSFPLSRTGPPCGYAIEYMAKYHARVCVFVFARTADDVSNRTLLLSPSFTPSVHGYSRWAVAACVKSDHGNLSEPDPVQIYRAPGTDPPKFQHRLTKEAHNSVYTPTCMWALISVQQRLVPVFSMEQDSLSLIIYSWGKNRQHVPDGITEINVWRGSDRIEMREMEVSKNGWPQKELYIYICICLKAMTGQNKLKLYRNAA